MKVGILHRTGYFARCIEEDCDAFQALLVLYNARPHQEVFCCAIKLGRSPGQSDKEAIDHGFQMHVAKKFSDLARQGRVRKKSFQRDGIGAFWQVKESIEIVVSP